MNALFLGLLFIAISIVCLGVSIVVAVRSTDETIKDVFHSKVLEKKWQSNAKK